MTEKKLYHQVVKNLKETLISLEEIDPFLVQELHIITSVIEKTPSGCITKLPQGPLPVFPKEASILLAGQFLKKCNPEYEKRLYKDYKIGNIIISPEVTEDKVDSDNNNETYKVYVHETGTIGDAYALVHEYFHTLNINTLTYRNAFTESVSISAELLFLDFLVDQGISPYDISIINNRRTSSYGISAAYLRKILPLYETIKEGKIITAKTYQENKQNFTDKNDFLTFIASEIINTPNKDRIENISSYKHVFGYICGSIFHQTQQSTEELTEANASLKNADIEKFNLLLAYSIFMSDLANYVKEELEYFKSKTYTKNPSTKPNL